jgi:hypothetical protein
LRKLAHLTGLACALAGAGALGAACTSKSGPTPPGAEFDAAIDATFEGDSGAGEAGEETGPGMDASVMDATPDVHVAVDSSAPVDSSSPVDTGVAAEAGACQPGSAAGFVAPAYVGPNSQFSNPPCFGSPVPQQYASACLGDASSYAACTTFYAGAEGGACLQCLASTTPGSPVVLGGAPAVDYAACIAALDPTDAGVSCAMQLQVAAACIDYVCAPSCQVVDQPSENAYEACVATAATGVCAGYSTPASACLAAEQGDGGSLVAQTCLAGLSQSDNFLAIATYFCSKS